MEKQYELFLKDRIGAIDANRFSEIYSEAHVWFDKSEDIGVLTDIFLECGIAPHNYFDYSIIGEYAYSSQNIRDVKIKDSIERINFSAFQNSSIESITFGKESQLQHIGIDAFKDCIYLKSIHLPNMLEVISDDAFMGCNNLEHIYFGKNILRMFGNSIFEHCNKLTIHCYEGSKPHTYAIEHNINFELIV